MTEWTNDAAIREWGTMPRSALEQMEPEGDFCRVHLLNPVLLRMLGCLEGARVLDAGCGPGYFCRMLADRGAHPVGVEPAGTLFDYAMELETAQPRGILYVQADLCALPDLGGPFDAVVANVVLSAIPDWKAAMRSCVDALKPGGIFVFSVNHPCFERLATVWREHGEYRIREYMDEYRIDQVYAPDFHRPLSSYLNETVLLGCRLLEMAEPRLEPSLGTDAEGTTAYAALPNFAVIAVERQPK